MNDQKSKGLLYKIKLISYLETLENEIPDEIWYGTLLASKNRFLSFFRDLEAREICSPLPDKNKPKLLKELVSMLKISLRAIVIAISTKTRKDKFYHQEVRLLKTFLYPHQINENRFQDAFFGNFTNEFMQQPASIVLIDPLTSLKELNIFLDRNLSFLPWQSFLTLSNVLKVWQRIFFTSIFVEKIKWGETDFSVETRGELNAEIFSQSFFLHQLFLEAFKNMGHELKIKTIYSTYENNSWERMLILALRATSPKTQIIGFQHAMISEASVNYLLTKKEKMIMPHKLFVTGELVKNFLINNCNHNPEIIEVSGALRYPKLKNLKIKNGKINKVALVALEGGEHSLSLLHYLVKEAKSFNHFGIELIIRFHPAYPYTKAKEKFDFSLLKNTIISDKSSVYEDFDRSDFLLFKGSTVSLEALKAGLFVIHVSGPEILSSSPLISSENIAYEVNETESIDNVFEQILKLNDLEIKEKRVKQSSYVDTYLSPVENNFFKILS
jgi:hypothetical protein